jgi:hypothetical protein
MGREEPVEVVTALIGTFRLKPFFATFVSTS